MINPPCQQHVSHLDIQSGLRHYLAIMPSPAGESDAWSYLNFTSRVKTHMKQGPFAELLGTLFVGLCFSSLSYSFIFQEPDNIPYLKLRREAAFLYDAVRLYAWSLNKTITEQLGDPSNGTLIIENLKNHTYLRYPSVCQ